MFILSFFTLSQQFLVLFLIAQKATKYTPQKVELEVEGELLTNGEEINRGKGILNTLHLKKKMTVFVFRNLTGQ